MFLLLFFWVWGHGEGMWVEVRGYRLRRYGGFDGVSAEGCKRLMMVAIGLCGDEDDYAVKGVMCIGVTTLIEYIGILYYF